jgi:hypothetical protein
MLHYDGEPVSQPKPAALKTDKKTLDWINKEEVFIWRISRIYSEIVATTDAHPYVFVPFRVSAWTPP